MSLSTAKGGLLATFIFLSFFTFSKAAVIFNENEILNPMVVSKINDMGKELYDKSGIYVALAVGDSSSFEDLLKFENNLTKPYVLLLLSKSSHKVDILASKESLAFFNKDKVLSPYSAEGSILPILASNKGKDIYNASMLNGYSDIVEQIADYFNIKLESSIGNANRNTLNLLRILIYGFICFAIFFYFQRKIRRKKNV